MVGSIGGLTNVVGGKIGTRLLSVGVCDTEIAVPFLYCALMLKQFNYILRNREIDEHVPLSLLFYTVHTKVSEFIIRLLQQCVSFPLSLE